MLKSFYLFIFCLKLGYTFNPLLKNNPESDQLELENCFCQLEGNVDDCLCDVDTVDYFNNMKIFPRLQSLLQKDYFRYFKYNARKACPFWNSELGRCKSRGCVVQPCTLEEIPSGLKSENKDCNETEHNNQVDGMISDLQILSDLRSWKAFDDSQSQFCELDPEDNCPDCDYVDLTLNPERFTGYEGEGAHKVWRAIYEENCFKPDGMTSNHFSSAFFPESLREMCLEKRAFYRAVSGLHASITVHLSSRHPGGNEDNQFSGLLNAPVYGPNLNLFKERFDPESTNGMGPYWLKNLYFVYLLELRALTKAAPILESYKFYTGNEEEDKETQIAVKEILNLMKSFPEQFDESIHFSFHGNNKEMLALKEDFRLKFKNITKIMDCVGCEKCKLWGKLQTTGLGTALKILFSSSKPTNYFKFPSNMLFETSGTIVTTPTSTLNLTRNEIVALFNAFGRISTSIQQLEMFRKMKPK